MSPLGTSQETTSPLIENFWLNGLGDQMGVSGNSGPKHVKFVISGILGQTPFREDLSLATRFPRMGTPDEPPRANANKMTPELRFHCSSIFQN